MIKKMMLLAMAVGALVAFAAPSVASAHQWTYEGAVIPEGKVVQEEYEGFLSFTSPAPPLPIHSTFGCEVTAVVQVAGTEDGTGHANATQFSPTTPTCVGTGIFAGCVLASHENTAPWTIDINPADLTITDVKIINFYAEGCAVPGSELTFKEITGVTTSNSTGIQTIHISGLASNGFTSASGTVHAETGGKLGVDY
jgi:hypothetical protein